MRWSSLCAGLAASALTVGGLGCERAGAAPPDYVGAAGSLALSRDDALLYAVDADSDTVAVVDAVSEQRLAVVPVGRAPERVAVGPDDTLYVTNRGGRSVSVIHRGRWQEAARVAVGVEPVGLAVAPDNRTLYVVNSTSLASAEVGTLMAIDLPSLQVRWEREVGPEPRGITLVEGGRAAVVTLFKEGDVVKVDLERGEVLGGGGRLYPAVNASRQSTSGALGFQPSTFHARAMGDVTAVRTGEGERVFAPVMWAREDAILTPPTVFGGYYANGGPCSVGAIATPGLVTFEAASLAPRVDDLTACATSGRTTLADFPPTLLLGSGSSSAPVQGPVAVVGAPTGDYVWVLNRESRNVLVLRTGTRQAPTSAFGEDGARFVVPVGQGANGIALTRDGTRAYVHNQFDHTITRIGQVSAGLDAQLVARATFTVGEESLAPEVAQGRRLFHDAVSPVLSAAGTAVACSTCHLEGREDGHTWAFPDGPRQTPSLAGRMLRQTAPFHWSGEFATLEAFFEHTVRLRMGGQGLDATQLADVLAYVDSLPAPDNPHRLPQPSEAQVRGRAVFERAGCAGCHAGALLTDNGLADVGTQVAGGVHPDTVATLNTPSLLTVARTAPYLHDGRAGTLLERLREGRASNTHGQTSSLTDAELDDLVAYLKSL